MNSERVLATVKRKVPVVGLGAVSLFFIVFIAALMGSPRSRGLLGSIGLGGLLPAQRGIYADCSQKSNQGNRYCRGEGAEILKGSQTSNLDDSDEPQFFKHPSNSLPFSLSD